MTIRRREEWGRPYEIHGNEPGANTDAEIADIARAEGRLPICVTGGDLFTSLGGRPSPSPHILDIDLLEVACDLGAFWAAAHVVARGPRWSGPFVVAMNATHVDGWNLGPRAHPNDSLVDVTEGCLGPSDRWKARRRAPSGSHVPHPALRESRVREYSATFDRPRTLWVDGVRRGSIRSLDVTVHPDAARIVL